MKEELKEKLLKEFCSEKIGLRIKELRCKMGWSVRELSEKVYIVPNAIHRIERGISTPSLSTLIYLALSLETSVDYILLGNELPVRCTNLAEGG